MDESVIHHSLPTIEEDDIKIVTELLQNKELDEGRHVTELENSFRNIFGVKYALAVTNGFSAIHLSLIGLGIKPGDEVIIPSYSCAALLNPVLIIGARPIIADLDSNTFNLSKLAIKKYITSKTKAIIIPHTFGFPADIADINTLGIPVIEDCAQSIGSSINNKLTGTFGELSIFSFYASKLICGGDGGMIITNNDEAFQRIQNLRYYGHKKMHKHVAYNYHLTNLPAALANNQLKKLTGFIMLRKSLAESYDSLFTDNPLIELNFENKAESSYYRYPILLKSKQLRDSLKQELKNRNINTGYGVLDGNHQLMDLPDSNFPNTMNLLDRILSIPIYPSLKINQLKIIGNFINDFTYTHI